MRKGIDLQSLFFVVSVMLLSFFNSTVHAANNKLTVSFDSDSLIEVNAFRVTDLEDKVFVKKFLPKLLSVYKNFGGETKAFFEVYEKEGVGFFEQSGQRLPAYLVYIQWPDIESRRAALMDSSYIALEQQRQELVTASNSVFLTVAENINFKLIDGRVYEFVAAVIDETNIADLLAFLDIILPGSEIYGRTDVVSFVQSTVPDGEWQGNETASLVEFKSPGAFFRFTQTDRFLDGLPLRANALERLDILVSEFNFKKDKKLKDRIDYYFSY